MTSSALFTALLLFLPQADPQANPRADPQEARSSDSAPLVKMAELQVVHFEPQHADFDELYMLADEMVSRQYYIVERGGYRASPVSNISALGRTLVLYDTKEYLGQMLSTLADLDRESVFSGVQEELLELQTYEYKPRYLSLSTVRDAVASFERIVHDEYGAYDNFSVSRDRGILIVREIPERVHEIVNLLARMDVPKQQVMLTVHLLSGVPGASSDGSLPVELVKNLTQLVPGMGFHPAGFALLNSSVGAGHPVTVQLDSRPDHSFQLHFTPVAYDDETGSLTVSECALMRTVGGPPQMLFQTSTVFRGNEYTVLGASGAEPVFVVVRLSPIRT